MSLRRYEEAAAAGELVRLRNSSLYLRGGSIGEAEMIVPRSGRAIRNKVGNGIVHK